MYTYIQFKSSYSSLPKFHFFLICGELPIALTIITFSMINAKHSVKFRKISEENIGETLFVIKNSKLIN